MDDGKVGLENNPLAINRIRQIERDIQAWADKPIEFSFDPRGTNLFSMEELARAFAKRAADFSFSIRKLIAGEHIMPAAVVGRALIETIGMGCLFLHDMDRLIVAGDRERFDARLTRFYVGEKGGAIETVHVMDAIRHLEKIDADYIRYLDQKYGTLSAAFERWKKEAQETSYESLSEALSAMKNYNFLSEVSHPNGTGTQFMYGQPSSSDAVAERLKQRFRSCALESIWQCHHLLRALENSVDLSERFRAKFMEK